jgi:hypothetical protein
MGRNEFFSVPDKERINLSMTVGTDDGSGCRQIRKKGASCFAFMHLKRVINLLTWVLLGSGAIRRTPNSR